MLSGLRHACYKLHGRAVFSHRLALLTKCSHRMQYAVENNARLIMPIPCPQCCSCQAVCFSPLTLVTVTFSHLVPNISEALHCWNFSLQCNVLVDPCPLSDLHCCIAKAMLRWMAQLYRFGYKAITLLAFEIWALTKKRSVGGLCPEFSRNGNTRTPFKLLF